MKRVLVNVIAFYVGWFACVLGAAHQYPLLGPVVTVIILVGHCYAMASHAREVRLIVTCGVLGFCLDTTLAASGVFTFQGSGVASWLSPPWMVSLWMVFATTFHTSLSWLLGRPVLAALFGGVGGPASYYAGAQLGAFSLHPQLLFSLGVIAIAWAGVMPILLRLAQHER